MSESQSGVETFIVAEDSKPNRTILVHLLKKFGFDVAECEDGQQAFETWKSRDNKNIVGIISDLMMPNMNGIEFLRNVRDESADIPFILITAVSDKDYIVDAKGLNVNGYILKPISFDKVQRKLKELFPSKNFPKLTG